MTSRAKRSGRIAASEPRERPLASGAATGAALTDGTSGGGSPRCASISDSTRRRGLVDELGRPGDAAAEVERPRDQQPRDRVVGAVDAAAVLGRLERAVGAVLALHVPRDVLGDLDLRRADRVAELPRDAAGELARIEVGGTLEVVLGLGRVGDLAADARELEHAHRFALARVSDEVELPSFEQEVIGIDLALSRLPTLHRVVLELDPLAAVDRGVDLRQAGGEVGAAGRGGDAEADRLARVGPERARAAPGDLLQREPQRLRVRELAVEQRERGLQRRALGVGERDRRQMERLGRERVVLLLAESVGRLVDREVDPERVELRAVRIETSGEGILGHVRVALDVAPDLRCRYRTPFGHQVGDQRQLPDQLFRVLRQTARHLRVPAAAYPGQVRKFRTLEPDSRNPYGPS